MMAIAARTGHFANAVVNNQPAMLASEWAEFLRRF